MERHQISVHTSGPFSEIRIDGEKVPMVRSFTLQHTVGEVPILTLEIISVDGDYEGEAFIETTSVDAEEGWRLMDDATRERIERLKAELAETQARVMPQLEAAFNAPERDPRFLAGQQLGRIGDAVAPHVKVGQQAATGFVAGVNRVLDSLPELPGGCRCKEGKDKVKERFNTWAQQMMQRRGG